MRRRVYWDGGRFLLWNARHAYELRCAHRIVGSTVGALPTNKRQTCEYGMPLSLMFEEALLAVEQGFAEVVDASTLRTGGAVAGAAAAETPRQDTPQEARLPITGWHGIDAECATWVDAALVPLSAHQLRLASSGRMLHAQVFRALWLRGFFITSGSGFGADYLCYPGDPLRHHAHLLVHVGRPGRPMRLAELACAARLANSVKKTAVLAESGEGADVRFTTVESPSTQHHPHAAMSTALGASSAAAHPHPASPPASTSASTATATPAVGLGDAEARAEVALQAPLQGAPSVPQPRERTRRPRAPWEDPPAKVSEPRLDVIGP